MATTRARFVFVDLSLRPADVFSTDLRTDAAIDHN
jgi:hypothetical protein